MSTSAAARAHATADSGAYAQAILNMLEDLTEERERLDDGHRAMLNILEDSVEEKSRLHQTHQAVMNILEDSGQERDRLDETQQAVLNVLEDSRDERDRLDETYRAVLNILEDLDEEREKIGQLNAELEDHVRRRTEELERSNRSLGAFTYSVAHDLRSPLRAMSGFSQALLEEYGERLDETGRGYAKRVCDASVRMARLIDDLLRLSHLSRAELHRQAIDLSAVVRAIAADLQVEEPTRRVTFDVEDGIVAPVDRDLFRTVLENLLHNAWKFTAQCEQTRIEFGALDAEEGKTGFFVRDNGVGFDEAYADKLFEPFQRLHSAAEYAGTGIGLASARQVVERHGGTIWAKSALDEGATFYVTIDAGEHE